MIDPNVKAVIVLGLGRAVDEVVGERAVGGSRIQPAQRDRVWILSISWDLVVWELCAGLWIENRSETVEISPAHRQRGNRRRVGIALSQPKSGVISKKERLLGDDSASETSAELMLFVLRL